MFFLLQTPSLFNLYDLQLIAPELIDHCRSLRRAVMEVILPYKLSKVDRLLFDWRNADSRWCRSAPSS
jgi:hypothetical protein